MAYNHEHREALGFLIMDLLQLHNRHTQLSEIDLDVLKLDNYCSDFSENDERFRKEWKAIQEDRKAAQAGQGYVQGQEGCEEEDLAFRMREMKALKRACNQAGVLRRNAPPRTKWNPLEDEESMKVDVMA